MPKWYIRAKYTRGEEPDPILYNIHLCHHDALFLGPFRWRWRALISLKFAELGNPEMEFYISQDDTSHRLITPGGDDYWKWLAEYEKSRLKFSPSDKRHSRHLFDA